MAGNTSKYLLGTAACVLIAGGVAWAGSQGSTTIGGVPVFALAVGMAFLIQWLVFIPSFAMKTEHYFDITGSATYMLTMTMAVLASGNSDSRSLLLLLLVLVWAGRLGTFLFRRVRRAGKDGRFDEIKHSGARFFMTWTIQGLWVSLTLAAALAGVTSVERVGLDAFAAVGVLVWALGFAFEVVADTQKSRFKADSANSGEFISSGLWAWSRHPNYFGEIALWTGVAIIALPAMSGWQYVTLISPVFVFVLLTRVSGIPLLEKRADEKWGGTDAYEAYRRKTPLLIPRPPHSG
jgi:steroid 5-alpha reductase family enzyme